MKLIIRYLLILLFIGGGIKSFGQQPGKRIVPPAGSGKKDVRDTAVLKTAGITPTDSVKLFIGVYYNTLRRSDGPAFKACFLDSSRMQTLNKNKEGNNVIRTENLEKLAITISAIPVGQADEQITFDAVKVDGNYAFVAVSYRFFAYGVFHHCGTNAFQLLRVNDRWKIYSMMDVPRTTGCP